MQYRHTAINVYLPADEERELLSARLDSVLGLHVGHGGGAVAVDGQDGVPRTEVPLGRLASRRHLSQTHNRTHGNTQTHSHTHIYPQTYTHTQAQDQSHQRRKKKMGKRLMVC